ncbi:aminopeptidase N-like [Styela clava]
MGGTYDTMGSGNMPKNGFFLSKTAVILGSIVVVALFVVEGLLIGLVGRPVCEPYAPLPESTKAPQSSSTTAGTSTTTTDATETGPWTNIRLPNNLIPDDYEVELRPVLEADTAGKYWFYGTSSVWYRCVEPTNHIIIHSNKLDYATENLVLEKDGTIVNIKSSMFYVPNQYLVVETEDPCIKDGYYKLTVKDFVGELTDDLAGLYRSEYVNSAGDNVVIATTQMQATDARKTFPCFDEPALKANFTITLWVKDGTSYFPLCNMPKAGTKTDTFDGESWTGTVFQESVPMSTYLLAMVISDFGVAENTTSDGTVQTNIYGRKELMANGDAAYAALVTPAILDYFADYFKIPYPLPKSDQVGVPDFGAGAMENWGLIIYREPYILYNSSTTAFNYKITVTSIVAHELAHMWFGNLVSPAWWDDLWLNEGFATYLSYLGEAAVQPTWKSKERFITDDLQGALSVDELTTSRPLVTEVNTPAQISAQFDTISYNKGASIIRMINSFLGEENFVNGLSEYLKALSYDVATHGDLFSYWAKHTDGMSTRLPTDLETILETWTLQMGYPVINIQDLDPLSNMFTLSQEYFLIDRYAEPVHTEGSKKYNYKWYVPFTYIKGSNLAAGIVETVWIGLDDTVTISDSDFILGNIRGEGYYRVNYDGDTWGKLAAKLDSTDYQDIPEENRAQLLDDAFSLASGERLGITVPLEMSRYLYRDDSYIAWTTFMRNIRYFEYMLGRTPVFGTFCNYILELVVPSLYDKYGWEETDVSDDAVIERLTRQVGIDAACYYGNDECIGNATEKFQLWMKNPDNWGIIDSSFRSDILCAAIRNSGIEEWNFAWERHGAATDNPTFQTSLRYGLACSKDPWILTRYLEYTLDPKKVRKQDAIRTMQYIGGEEYGRDIAWAFMVDNWELLVNLFGSGWSFDGLIATITKRFSTEYDLEKLEDFKSNTPDLGTAVRAVDQAIEKTKINIKWRSDNEATLTAWFYDNVGTVL